MILFYICLFGQAFSLIIVSDDGIIYYDSTGNEVQITCKFNETLNESNVALKENDMLKVTAITSLCRILENDANAILQCDQDKREYTAKIPVSAITDGSSWRCQGRTVNGNSYVSQFAKVLSIVTVKIVHITPDGINNTVDIVIGKSRLFTCATDPSRPPAWIQWYIGTRNLTNEAVSKRERQDDDKFISSSTLNHTGIEVDHGKNVYCEAVNIEGRQKINSTKKNIHISTPVGRAVITPTTKDNMFLVVSRKDREFTCTTDSGRPPAWIHWYIGTQNITDKAVSQPAEHNGTKFISSSKLNYTGNVDDHNEYLFCEAANIIGMEKVESEKKVMFIQVSVASVFITPPPIKRIVTVVIGETHEFTCTTNPSRPAARIHWHIGGQNVTNDAVAQTTQEVNSMFISSSKLNYTGIETDHNTTVYCEAVNIEGSDKVKTAVLIIYIQLPVTTITISTEDASHVARVIKGETIEFTCTTDSGRPAALIYWYLAGRNVTNDAVPQPSEKDGTKYISSSKLNYTGNETDHKTSVYCEANNIEGRLNINSVEIKIDIQVLVTAVTIEHNDDTIFAVSGRTTNFTCTAHLARPAAWIHWYIDQQNVSNDATTTVVISTDSKYNTRSYLPYLGSIYDHDKNLFCNAGNIPGKATKISSVTLLINSSTVANGKLMTDVGVLENKGFNLSISLIANPEPTIYWKFMNLSGFEFALDNTGIKTIRDGVFRYVTMYQKSIAADSDFGNYTMFASNGIGEDFKHSISVAPTQRPRSPYGIFADCFQNSANITWLSNFNGGDHQHFTVVLTDKFHNAIFITNEVSDEGRGEVHFIVYENLQSDTTYEIYVRAINTFGRVNSTEVTNCTTDSFYIEDQGQSTVEAVVGGVSGSVFALFVIMVIAVFVFRRRWDLKGSDSEHLKTLEDKDTENEEDGIKDNPLYVSSADADDYKTGNKCKTTMQAKQSKAKGKPLKNKTDGGKGSKSQRIEMDCVYENSDDLRKDDTISNTIGDDAINKQTSRECIKKKNKDGLIYADLEFASAGSNGKCVIRGLENRTNYAMIDLSRKADPMPDSDDDDADLQSESKEELK